MASSTSSYSTYEDRTVIGPLTTIFTPPPECSTLQIEAGQVGWGERCTHSAGDNVLIDRTECFPSGLFPTSEAFISFYSPGSDCPHGFTQACTVSREYVASPSFRSTNQAEYSVWKALELGETAIRCCPSRFKCDTEWWNFCSPTAPLGAVYSGVSYDGACTATSTTFTVNDNSRFHGQARAVIFVLPKTASSTPLKSSTPPKPPSRTTPPAQIPQTSASSSSGGVVSSSRGGLSTSAKIAIGVAVPAIIILGAVILALLMFRKRRRRRQHNLEGTPVIDVRTSPNSWGSPGAKSELSGDGMAEADNPEQPKLYPFFAAARNSELDADPISRWRRSELAGTTPWFELPAEDASLR